MYLDIYAAMNILYLSDWAHIGCTVRWDLLGHPNKALMLRSRRSCVSKHEDFPGARDAEKSIHRTAAENRIWTLNSRTSGRQSGAPGASLNSKFRCARVCRAMNGKVSPRRPRRPPPVQ